MSFHICLKYTSILERYQLFMANANFTRFHELIPKFTKFKRILL